MQKQKYLYFIFMQSESKSSNSKSNRISGFRDSEETMVIGEFSRKYINRKFSFSYEESLSFDSIDFSHELSQVFSDSFNYQKRERSKSIGKSNNCYYLIFYLLFIY